MPRTTTPLRTVTLALVISLAGVALAAGETPTYVSELTLLLVVSAGVAFGFFRLGVTPIIGFLLAGVLTAVLRMSDW